MDFSTFSEVFERVWTRSDAFGCNRMHFGTLGCVRTLPEKFGFFRKFEAFLGNLGSGGVLFRGFYVQGVYFFRGVLLGARINLVKTVSPCQGFVLGLSISC